MDRGRADQINLLLTIPFRSWPARRVNRTAQDLGELIPAGIVVMAEVVEQTDLFQNFPVFVCRPDKAHPKQVPGILC